MHWSRWLTRKARVARAAALLVVAPVVGPWVRVEVRAPVALQLRAAVPAILRPRLAALQRALRVPALASLEIRPPLVLQLTRARRWVGRRWAA
ncbi:MAG: hypothetical protein WAN81_23060 [Candidatus Binataceae bacterium]